MTPAMMNGGYEGEQYQQEQYQQQPQMQQQQMQQQPQVDDVTLAKQALGLDQYEMQIQQMQAQMEESKNNALFKEVSLAHTNTDPDLVKAELLKMQETNPQMAQMLTGTKEGLDMLFTKVRASMKPTDAPDNLNESGDTGINSSGDYNKKVSEGTANEVDLGEFVLQNA